MKLSQSQLKVTVRISTEPAFILRSIAKVYDAACYVAKEDIGQIHAVLFRIPLVFGHQLKHGSLAEGFGNRSRG